jgi:hypothetical protein
MSHHSDKLIYYNLSTIIFILTSKKLLYHSYFLDVLCLYYQEEFSVKRSNLGNLSFLCAPSLSFFYFELVQLVSKVMNPKKI